MANHNLSEGCLKNIMAGTEIPDPIVQVLGTKKIQSNSADKDRFRILLSDGKYTISFAMLTTSINDSVGRDGIPTNSIIKITKYVTNILNNAKGETRVLLILGLDIVADGSVVGGRIGSPVPLSDTGHSSSTTSTSAFTNTVPKPTNSYQNGGTSHNGTSSTSMDTSLNMTGQITHPIASLSPYHNKWVIKARVTNKSAIRTWSNSRGEGKLFSMDLVDESGEIRCTGFRDSVDKYYDMIQVDKLYYISKCQLKPANKQYTTLKNDYEMTMTGETVIQLVPESEIDGGIPEIKYDFINIDKLANIEVGTLVDVIGVCKSASDLVTFQAKTTGRELKKREVTLVDQSNTSVSLTLWGTDAENFTHTDNPVIVVKGARIGEFGGGKNLNLQQSTQFRINPDIKECHRLRGWYDNEGKTQDATNISARTGSGNFDTQWMSFKEVQDQNLGHSEKGDYYQVMGTILLMNSENAMYKACASDDCNKKVIDMENGQYRCEKCNKEAPNFKYRLLAHLNVGDWSGNQWVSMFSSDVEKILGMTAEEVGAKAQEDPQNLVNICNSALFKQFVMKCRTKMETYNDEARLKTVVIKVDPINYTQYNNHLIDSIQHLLE